MTRKKLLLRGVLASYGAVICQIAYSFATIPLALSHLSKAEFGMFGLSMTIMGYLMLAEMGMTNSATRHLMECKSGGDPGKYGRIFTGSALALGAVALAIIAIGLLASGVAWRFFPIPPDLVRSFTYLMIGQTLLSSITMATQILGVPLYIHHRQDLSQLSQIGIHVISYIALRFGFQAGWGIYAFLVSAAASLVWGIGFKVVACLTLGFYPATRHIRMPARDEWSSIWILSRHVFVIQIGRLLLQSIPQLSIVKLLGLEAGATWAVCTRPFAILSQIVNRPFDVALPVIYETYIHNDMRGVVIRWSEMTQMIMALAGVAFAVAAANNEKFITLWTHGRIHWDAGNDWLLILYFFVLMAGGLASAGLGMRKTIGKSRFIGLIQAPLTILLAIPLAKWLGVPGLILAISIPYVPGLIYFGVRYLAGITGHAPGPLFWQGFLRPALAMPVSALAAWLCTFAGHGLPGYFGLLLSAASGSLAALGCMIFLGVSHEVRAKMFALAAKAFRRFALIPRASQ
jgi:O-antigen/teichoic acid export membrane protein